MSVAALLLASCLASLAALEAPPVTAREDLEVVAIDGDLVVKEAVSYEGKHLKVTGNVFLETGGTLTLKSCRLELQCRYSREFVVEWRGGSLVTEDVCLGGRVLDGIRRHCNLRLWHGRWDAIDTRVSYCYGITFSGRTQGVLRATRLSSGVNSDAVICGGRADVELTDCVYPIALHADLAKGGELTLDLPRGVPVTRTFDRNTFAGVTYRLQLKNHLVKGLWFLFFGGVSPKGKPARVTFANCPRVLPAISGWNLAGELAMSMDLAEPVTIGNVTFAKTGELGITSWSLYLRGKKTDLALRGPLRFAEIMLRQGKVTLVGDPERKDVESLCTTIDLHQGARLTMRHCSLGRGFAAWQKAERKQGNRGQISVHEKAVFVAEDADLGPLLLKTDEGGTITLTGCRAHGELVEDGEGISVEAVAVE